VRWVAGVVLAICEAGEPNAVASGRAIVKLVKEVYPEVFEVTHA
jgi:hypothetical protein